MADNDYDPAGSTQMFRAFVDETPAPQAPAPSPPTAAAVAAAVPV
ncbi:hypothetical protein [Kitasatospora paranensis]